jgi:hypothetical protein
MNIGLVKWIQNRWGEAILKTLSNFENHYCSAYNNDFQILK